MQWLQSRGNVRSVWSYWKRVPGTVSIRIRRNERERMRMNAKERTRKSRGVSRKPKSVQARSSLESFLNFGFRTSEYWQIGRIFIDCKFFLRFLINQHSPTTCRPIDLSSRVPPTKRWNGEMIPEGKISVKFRFWNRIPSSSLLCDWIAYNGNSNGKSSKNFIEKSNGNSSGKSARNSIRSRSFCKWQAWQSKQSKQSKSAELQIAVSDCQTLVIISSSNQTKGSSPTGEPGPGSLCDWTFIQWGRPLENTHRRANWNAWRESLKSPLERFGSGSTSKRRIRTDVFWFAIFALYRRRFSVRSRSINELISGESTSQNLSKLSARRD